MVNPVKGSRPEIYGLAQNLVEKGHEIVILQPKSSIPLFDFTTPNLRDINHEKIHVIKFPCVFIPKIRYTLPDFGKEYRILLKLVDKGADLVHAAQYFYPTVFPVLHLKRRKSIPVMVSNDSLVGVSWSYGSIPVDYAAYVYTKTLGKIVFTQCDALTFFYEDLAKKACSLGASPDKVSIVPNGVDTTLFNTGLDAVTARDQLGMNKNKKIIVSVGRLVPVKHIEALIKVTRILVREGVDITTYYVGDGPYRDYYQKMAADIKDHFVFLGQVPYQKIPLYMAACDAFLLPSLSEGLPTAVLEAGACGKPVVASRVGGIPDVITHGETGFLVDSTDIDAFCRYTRIVLQDESLAKKVGMQLNNHVIQNFSWDVVTQRYEDVYTTLVND